MIERAAWQHKLRKERARRPPAPLIKDYDALIADTINI